MALRGLDPNYGSDKAGMVCGYAFTRESGGVPIGPDAAAAWMADPKAGGFVWLHFNLSNSASTRWLDQHVALPEGFHAIGANTSTRIELVDDAMMAVLNDVLYTAADVSSASTMTLYVTSRVLVSARVTPLRSVDRLRAAVKDGGTFRSPVDLLAHLLRDQADVLVQIVRDTTSQVDGIEDRVLGQAITSGRSRLGSLRRSLVRLQRLLAPEPAALFRLLNRPPAWMPPEDLQELRQAAEELAAAVADSVALVERVRLLQEELVALVNEQTGRTLFVLTVVTVLALPLTIVPGFFGMNVGGLPFRDHPQGFWLVVAGVLAVAACAAFYALGRRSR